MFEHISCLCCSPNKADFIKVNHWEVVRCDIGGGRPKSGDFQTKDECGVLLDLKTHTLQLLPLELGIFSQEQICEIDKTREVIAFEWMGVAA
jgi:hypothetical protein